MRFYLRLHADLDLVNKGEHAVTELTRSYHVLSAVVVSWLFVLGSELLSQSEASTLQ